MRSKYCCYWTEPNKKGKRRDFQAEKSREVQLTVIPLEVESAAGLLLGNCLNAATGVLGESRLIDHLKADKVRLWNELFSDWSEGFDEYVGLLVDSYLMFIQNKYFGDKLWILLHSALCL